MITANFPDIDKFLSLDAKSIQDEFGMYISERMNTLLKQRYAASGIRNRTGNLASSIRVSYNVATHSIQMGVIMYGVFLSYGVGPRPKKGRVYDIDEWVLKSMKRSPSGNGQFSYNPSHRKYGLRARKWIISDEALDLIIRDFVKDYELQLNASK